MTLYVSASACCVVFCKRAGREGGCGRGCGRGEGGGVDLLLPFLVLIDGFGGICDQGFQKSSRGNEGMAGFVAIGIV